MLHKGISISMQVSQLTEFAQLLFTWIIPHLDDFGKLDGNAKVIKALVMPMSERPLQEFEEALQNMIDIGLIERYETPEGSVLSYPKFEKYQQGLNKRTKSKYIDNTIPGDSEKLLEVPGNSQPTEENETETNPTEINKSEPKEKIIADKKIPYKKTRDEVGGNTPPLDGKPAISGNSPKRAFAERNPKTFEPQNSGEAMAKEVWEKLEPNNSWSFFSTYLKPVRKGLPPDLLYQFCSEISQDSSVKEPGKVMNKKIKDYFESKGISY